MKYVIDVPDKYVSKEDGQLYVALRSEECDESLNPTWVCTGYHCEPYNQQSAFNKGMDSYKFRKYGDCDKCLREFGTLGCYTTVFNQWVYSCEDGMLEYARKEGYAEGWEKGYSDCHDKEIGYKDGYHAGLEDAWECAGKITEICLADAWECFGTDSIGEVIKNHTASEAIQKLEGWEEKQKEIKVGDEVKLKLEQTTNSGTETKNVCVVTWVSDDGDGINGIASDGGIVSCPKRAKSLTEKTGRYFPQIQKVMDAMRGGLEWS